MVYDTEHKIVYENNYIYFFDFSEIIFNLPIPCMKCEWRIYIWIIDLILWNPLRASLFYKFYTKTLLCRYLDLLFIK